MADNTLNQSLEVELKMQTVQHLSVLFGWIEQARKLSENFRFLIASCDEKVKELCKQNEMFAVDWCSAESEALVNLAAIQENFVRELIEATQNK